MYHPRSRHVAAVAVAATLLLGAAACGSSDSGSSTSSGSDTRGTKDADIAKMVPKKLQDAGKIVVAADASYAPNEFFDTDNTTVIGMDADLAKALGDVMGVPATVSNANFDAIIPSLGKRYDLGMSSFTDTKEREKTVDFVDYFNAGTSFYVQKGKNSDITSLGSICGKKVAVEKGTTQLDDATAQKAKCGDNAPTVLTFQDQGGANVALAAGRADVSMADSPVAAYAVKQSKGKFELAGDSYGNAPYGIAIPKGADYKGLTEAVKAAIEKLKDDGVYDAIMQKWGVADGAVDSFTVNGATS
jgi:polar amino acid transport system substrate-binding protein